MLIAGNMVSGQAGFLQSGIYGIGIVNVSSNVVFDNYDGIAGYISGAVSNNRVYHNANAGLNLFNAAMSPAMSFTRIRWAF